MENQTFTAKLLARFKTIKSQLTFTYTLLIVVVAACILLALAFLMSLFTQQNSAIASNTMEIIGESVENRITNLRKLIPVIKSDHQLNAALAGKESPETAAGQMSTLYAYGLQHRYLINNSGRALDPVYGSDDGSLLELAGYQDFIHSGKDEFFSAPHEFPFANPLGNRISYFHYLRDAENQYRVSGSSLFIVSIDSLFSDRIELANSMFDDYYVIDGKGNLIYSLHPESAGSASLTYAVQQFAGSRGSQSQTAHEGNLYFSRAIASYPDWQMVGVVANTSFNRNILLVAALVSLLGLGSLVLVAAFSRSISKEITEPVAALNKAMVRFESGEIPDKIEAPSASAEMATLVGGFNHMLDNIRSHMDTIVLEQEEKKTAEVAALQFQLESLQNQINPHFLYNTLNIISFLALDGKRQEIRDFNQALISLLRATLSNTQDTVSISHEVTTLEAYVRIMAYRYPDEFDVHIVTDENILDCQIPKLILQPLVENAMLHGIIASGKKGSIVVVIEDREKWVHITVGDDGVGMDEAQLDSLFLPRKGFTGIGLNNVNDRLKLCYGPESGLIVSSEKDMGTLVMFKLPKTTLD